MSLGTRGINLVLLEYCNLSRKELSYLNGDKIRFKVICDPSKRWNITDNTYSAYIQLIA